MNKQTAQMLEKHFDIAFAAPGGIKKLRELILTLAMQGKLVPQDANDQPASELLKEIEAEKLKSGLTRRREDAKKIKPEEVPYQVPAGWEWVSFFSVNTVQSEPASARDYPYEKQIALDSIEKGSGRLLFHRTVTESGAMWWIAKGNSRSGGITKLRCLLARNDPKVTIEIELAEKVGTDPLWR